ncbi:uncharacterized protein LOC116603372 [Nematostella vectensis]|uniref:uncharacterized protein LOC116603372 n=1 Tax=Nematostella vectensis TaxID=45351 RepID=UPI0013902285|nr:uncharacterized protein LOC116603372 [Nematostella vectensis]
MEAKKKVTQSEIALGDLRQRQAKGRNLYYEIFKHKMDQAPNDINQFCNPKLEEESRQTLLKWIRDLDDRSSSQSLQILFSFSIPSSTAIDEIINLHMPVISAGAGTGYWEYLLHERGADIVMFDHNKIYPEGMRYLDIQTGGPELLRDHQDRVLLIAWPDNEESSTFGIDCLNNYKGDTIIHIGELLGETFSANPWGQSSSRDFQLRLAETFRCVSRVQLPNWPGHMDSLTIWSRVDHVDSSTEMVYIASGGIVGQRYYGWKN